MSEHKFEDYMETLIDSIADFDRVKASDIPSIDLYMDQVTTFMDDHLGLFRRNEEEKILTKTMINNYSKYHLLPPTVRKKYTNDHIILMLFIYYMKPILSITDIKELLDPIKSMFLDNTPPNGIEDLKDLHDKIVATESEHHDVFKDRMMDTVQISQDLFKDVKDPKQQELLSIFATSYLFTIQASAQKYMITSLIDKYLSDNPTLAKKPVKDKKERKPKK